MPAFDKTGPKGEGPRTGRGMGDCEVDKTQKAIDLMKQVGRGLGRGRGGNGRGRNGLMDGTGPRRGR